MVKKLLIIGDGESKITLADVARFGIGEVRNLTLAEFNRLDEFESSIIMKGLVETSDFMRRVLEINKSFGGGFISHCGVFKRADQAPFIVTDSALNIAPTLRDKEGITKNAVLLSRRLKLCDSPVVNFITPSSKIVANIKSSVDACYLESFIRENFPDIKATHNALDVCFTDSAKLKNIEDSPRPDILVCDNIDQGNALYKALTVFGGFMTAGFVVGNEKMPPVILTSRSDSLESKLWSVELSSL
ncbi:MAG: phosphate acyltransferase [Alphaproteobacteria bacterium]|nr:phosphate acyltransferase [Alphaproteobacteria bacterium]